MANHAVNGKNVPLGVNQSNIYVIEAIATAAAAADTFTISTPDGLDQLCPMVARVMGFDGSVLTQYDVRQGTNIDQLLVTNWDPTVRQIVLTVPAGMSTIVAGDKILVFCAVAP